MNLCVSVLRLLRPIMAYAVAQRTHTHSFSSLPASPSLPFPPSLLHTDWPLCAGTDEICMHVRLDYTYRLWEPGPLWSPLTVWVCVLPFQSSTSNKSHILIGSGTYRIKGYIPRFGASWRKKKFWEFLCSCPPEFVSITHMKRPSLIFYIHQRSDS